YHHAWRIRWDVLRRHILRSSLTGGNASCMVEVYHMARDFMRSKRVLHGNQETPYTASTTQAVLRITCSSAAPSCLGVHRVRHYRRTARQSATSRGSRRRCKHALTNCTSWHSVIPPRQSLS